MCKPYSSLKRTLVKTSAKAHAVKETWSAQFNLPGSKTKSFHHTPLTRRCLNEHSQVLWEVEKWCSKWEKRSVRWERILMQFYKRRKRPEGHLSIYSRRIWIRQCSSSETHLLPYYGISEMPWEPSNECGYGQFCAKAGLKLTQITKYLHWIN